MPNTKTKLGFVTLSAIYKALIQNIILSLFCIENCSYIRKANRRPEKNRRRNGFQWRILSLFGDSFDLRLGSTMSDMAFEVCRFCFLFIRQFTTRISANNYLRLYCIFHEKIWCWCFYTTFFRPTWNWGMIQCWLMFFVISYNFGLST